MKRISLLYFVYSFTGTSPLCTGVILTKRHILSSASCVIRAQSALNTVSNLQVVAGTTIYDDPNQVSNVKSIWTPPTFEMKEMLGQDIAILKLDKSLHLNKQCRLKSIKLPEKNYRPPGNKYYSIAFLVLLELRQYKKDSIQSKKLPSLNLPRFFSHLHGEKKSAAISKLACFSQKRDRSYIVLALVLVFM